MQRALFLSAAIISAAAIAHAQEQPGPRTLISSNTLNTIARRVSGAQVRNDVLVRTGAYSVVCEDMAACTRC